MTNDDISCFLYFSVIPSKKSRCFWLSNSGGLMQAAAKEISFEYLTEEKFCSITKIKAYTILERKDT